MGNLSTNYLDPPSTLKSGVLPNHVSTCPICFGYWKGPSSITGWWFGTFFVFPNSWDDDPIKSD